MALSRESLRRQATARGVRHRLIFSNHLEDHADHLERMAAADIALDTRRYTAGSVAVEVSPLRVSAYPPVCTEDLPPLLLQVLLACIPLITIAGASVAARQAASVSTSTAMGLLVTHTLKEYYELNGQGFAIIHI